MPSTRVKRQGTSKSVHLTHALRAIFTICLFAGLRAHLAAQLPKPAAPPPSTTGPASATAAAAATSVEPAQTPTTPPVAIHDPLGRETPHNALMGLLKYGAQQDFATAARYLQPTPGQDSDLVQRVKELQALYSQFHSNIALLSNDPNGSIDAGLPPGQVRAGVLEIGGTTTEVVLVRVDDPAVGKIWLLSKETVAKIPKLYAQQQREGPTRADLFMPSALTSRHLLGMSLGQWLGWLLSIQISWLLAWLSTVLLSAPRRVWCKLHKRPFRTLWDTPLGVPLRCILAILVHLFFVYQLGLPLLYRAYYFRFIAGLLAGCFAWFVSRLADEGFDRAVGRTRIYNRGGESILILMQRLTRILISIIAVICALALFGINVKATLAGLGIGGLAIALAAQKTLENLIGGVSLLMDKAVSLGDLCQIGDQIGTVEDIGLRSLKLRSLDQKVLIVPNGSLAGMHFQNMTRRPKLLINQTFSLRIESQVEQLRFVLDRVQSMLDQHSGMESHTSRVRIMGFVGAAFELELFAYVKTGDWIQFTTIRQEVILKITEIVEASGTRLAAPTRLNYHSRDIGINGHRGNATVSLFVPLDSEITGHDLTMKSEQGGCPL
jgi:MscS family membrane protein